MKPLFPTAVILVCDPIHVSHLNSILMLCECFGERMTLEVALKYWSRTWIKISSFGSKVPLCFVHAEKRQLKWIGKSMIFSLFSSRPVLLHLRDCKGSCLWMGSCAWILWVKTENGGGVRSHQFIGYTYT